MKQVASRATRATAKKVRKPAVGASEAIPAENDAQQKRAPEGPKRATRRASGEPRPNPPAESAVKLPGKLEHWPTLQVSPGRVDTGVGSVDPVD